MSLTKTIFVEREIQAGDYAWINKNCTMRSGAPYCGKTGVIEEFRAGDKYPYFITFEDQDLRSKKRIPFLVHEVDVVAGDYRFVYGL